MSQENTFYTACNVVKQGGIIAYPTEAVFGIGCDPCNEEAVMRVTEIKSRPVGKGFILIASKASQLDMLCDITNEGFLRRIKNTWPGPNTWVFPVADTCPQWLCAGQASIAVRISAHPPVITLCDTLGSALISTSANLSGGEPARTVQQVRKIFGDAIHYIVEGEVGDLDHPTTIRDVSDGRVIRE